jgi:glutamate-1-semialdehyde 2,1-aminomutase
VESSGLNARALEDTIALPFNDLDAAARALAREDLACLFVEPMMGGAGCIPANREYLAGLRELTARHRTLLVFDEVITGFRLAPGGAQQHYGITPDLTTLGKILGGGFPIGALCGRRDVFARLDHRQAGKSERVFQGGTFSANPISLTAGLETLKALQAPGMYERLDALGSRMRAGLAAAFAEHGIAAGLTGLGSTVGIHFRAGGAPTNPREAADDDASIGEAYFDHLRGCGIAFLSPPLPHLFISAAHTEADIDAFIQASREFAGGRPSRRP